MSELSGVTALLVTSAVLAATRHASPVSGPDVGPPRPETETPGSVNSAELFYSHGYEDDGVFTADDSYDGYETEEYPGGGFDSGSSSSSSPDPVRGAGQLHAPPGSDDGEATPRLPQAIIVGVKKGGTRALLEYLRVHPKVRAPGPEMHFFDRHYDKGLDWYRSLMPPTTVDQTTIEKTPSYFVTQSAPARVYNMSRSARIIVVVRDPVTRAISDYTQVTTKRRLDRRSFAEMAFLDNATGPVATSWGAIKIGLYAKHLERWGRFFPRAQLHFVSGERLVEDPVGEMAKLEDFLGIGRYITCGHFYFNATKGFPCLRRTEWTGTPHCLGKTKGRLHPSVDEKILQRLRNFYRPFNEKFYQMTGINFGWS